jgi:hypothetical protein
MLLMQNSVLVLQVLQLDDRTLRLEALEINDERHIPVKTNS